MQSHAISSHRMHAPAWAARFLLPFLLSLNWLHMGKVRVALHAPTVVRMIHSVFCLGFSFPTILHIPAEVCMIPSVLCLGFGFLMQGLHASGTEQSIDDLSAHGGLTSACTGRNLYDVQHVLLRVYLSHGSAYTHEICMMHSMFCLGFGFPLQGLNASETEQGIGELDEDMLQRPVIDHLWNIKVCHTSYRLSLTTSGIPRHATPALGCLVSDLSKHARSQLQCAEVSPLRAMLEEQC